MAYIYKITNDINNKVYIGKTELQNPEDRWKEHINDYKRERYGKRPLYYAMNKYGVNHFHFEIIEETDDPEEREKFWINELNTYVGFKNCNGYNATLGGDGKCYLNLDEDAIIKYHIEDACYIVGHTAKYFGVDKKTIINILKKHNIVWINNEACNRLINYMAFGGVFQLDMNCKYILNIFENAPEANLHMGKKAEARNIRRACNGNHYAYGYMWYYGKDLHLIDNELINLI